MSSETQPSEAWHREMCFLLPTGSTHCQSLKSWIVAIIPNELIKKKKNKLLELWPHIQVPERDERLGQSPVYERKNDV